MANNKDFIVKNAVEVSGSVKTTVGTFTSGSEGYYLAGASYDSVSFSVASQDTSPRDVTFNNDGTKMYMVGATNDSVYQYSLSTAYDMSTASYDSVSFSVSGQDDFPNGVAFSNDGTKMYIVGDEDPSESVYQYSLSTAFDLSTASYDSVSFSITSQDENPRDLIFNSDGTKMYIMGNDTDSVYQYSLSTAFDLSTASYDSVSFSVSGQDTTVVSIAFNNDGSKMYIVGTVTDSVYQYTLSTAFDLSTASYDSVSFSVSSEDSNPIGITFNEDGTKMYVLGFANDTIYQYSTALATKTLDLSTGNYFNYSLTEDTKSPLSNAGDVQSFQLEVTGGAVSGYSLSTASYADKKLDVSSQEATVMGVQFKPDGTKMYIVGSSGDEVNEYTLNTAWDVTTAKYEHTFSVSSQHTNPRAMAFKSDGTVMYVTGTTADAVSQYTLSTAWDISTATYSSQFSVSSQEANPEGLFFKTDGTKMYVTGGSGDDVNEYALSTAWDVTTATYTTAFSVISQATTPSGLSFNDTGTAMFVLNRGSNTVYEYTLSTAWDLTTASYNSVSYVLASLADPSGLTFKPDGTKMYIADYTADAIYQYNTQVDTTITWPTSIEWAGGTAPSSPPLEVKNLYAFTTNDGGTTYTGVLSAYNLS